MKPVGLRDPRTGKTPWAVVQLRKENLRADSYNLVGFPESFEVWRAGAGAAADSGPRKRALPALRADSPQHVHLRAGCCWTETLRACKAEERGSAYRCFAGQICGVEGYTESIATGMLAGIYAAAIARGEEPVPVPRATALGSLVHYITHADAKNFQPANITFDLLEPLEEEMRKKIRDKKERHRMQCERALAAFDAWYGGEDAAPACTLKDGRHAAAMQHGAYPKIQEFL